MTSGAPSLSQVIFPGHRGSCGRTHHKQISTIFSDNARKKIKQRGILECLNSKVLEGLSEKVAFMLPTE